jgi:hypothetical protein
MLLICTGHYPVVGDIKLNVFTNHNGIMQESYGEKQIDQSLRGEYFSNASFQGGLLSQ